MLEDFDRFYTENYDMYLQYTESMCRDEAAHILHKAYEKCRNVILQGKYNGKDFKSYIYVAVRKTYLAHLRDEGRRKRRYEDVDVDTVLQEVVDDSCGEDVVVEQEMARSYIINGIYDYVDKYYLGVENSIFKIYFKLSNDKITYRRLAKISGYSVNAVTKIIQTIKKDIQENIAYYLENEMKKEEAQVLAEEIGLLLQKDVETNYGLYLQAYKKIYSTEYRGCACNKKRLWYIIFTWYNNVTINN